VTRRRQDITVQAPSYIPGPPEESVARGAGNEVPLKIASNENPLGPSPLALAAAGNTLSQCHRYPDGSGRLLRETLALRLHVPVDQVVLGNGSTELVELLARAFLDRSSNAVMSKQTFIMYRIAVLAAHSHPLEVPLKAMRCDLEALTGACDDHTRLVYIANPNNPTGTYVTSADLERYFERVPSGVVTVLDEAYAEYIDCSDYPSGLDFLRRGKRIVVLRTFSKIYGLAGLRIGYGLAPADLAAEMEKIRSPFNTGRIAQAAAVAALNDQEHLEHSRSSNWAGMALLEEGLGRLELSFVPSVANFVLVDVGYDAGAAHEGLLREGVITRPMGPYGFPTSLRVSVGTDPEIRRFLKALQKVLAGRCSSP